MEQDNDTNTNHTGNTISSRAMPRGLASARCMKSGSGSGDQEIRTMSDDVLAIVIGIGIVVLWIVAVCIGVICDDI